MGAAGKLFFNGDRQANTLHNRVTPSDEQIVEQQARWQDLADFLATELSAILSLEIRTWLQGSYKFKTQIKPSRGGENDVDLGVYALSDEPLSVSAKELKDYVQRILQDYEQRNSDIIEEVVSPAKERCNRIRYTGCFHIDVPSYQLKPKSDLRLLATEKNDWENSDPKKIYEWFKQEADQDQRVALRRLIRYLKAWAALKFEEADRPSSIMLTVVATEAFGSITNPLEHDDDDLFFVLINAIRTRFSTAREVRNPVDLKEDLNRLNPTQHDAFIAELGNLHSAADRASNTQVAFLAAQIWTETFDHLMPLPTETEDVQELVDKKFLPVPLMTPNIQITAVPRNNTNIRYSEQNSITIPKDCDIEFRLQNVPLNEMLEIEWMVRNEGLEAERVNDMGHRNVHADAVAHERSAYKGKQYMDCTIKKFGTIIGFRRVPVTITNTNAPLRNPPKPKRPSFR